MELLKFSAGVQEMNLTPKFKYFVSDYSTEINMDDCFISLQLEFNSRVFLADLR